MAKETTVKQANETAAKARKEDLKNLIIEEAMRLTSGKQHSVQQLMAYCRQLKSK